MHQRFATFRHGWSRYGEITLVAALAVAFTAVAARGHDFYPLRWALQLKLSGNSAYSPEMEALFRQYFPPKDAAGGFAYPLPAMWLALPLLGLPQPIEKVVFDLLSVSCILVGIWLLRMPLTYMFFFPVLMGLSVRNVTVLLVGMLLIGIWALRERRWWLLGIIVALTLAAKPQATALVATVLALLAMRAGGWRQIIICVLAVIGLTTALDPAWPWEWIAAVNRYRPTQELASLLPCLPIAVALLALRQPWAALAVVQVCLFPIMQKYALLPFLIGYTAMPDRRLAWVVVLCSWLLLPIDNLAPAWQTVGVSYVVPLLFGAAWLFWSRRSVADPALTTPPSNG